MPKSFYGYSQDSKMQRDAEGIEPFGTNANKMVDALGVNLMAIEKLSQF